MRILILAVGRVKERPLRSLLDDYYGRIGRYAKLEEVELKDGETSAVVARFRRAIPERSRVVALEVLGRSWSSEGLSRYVSECELDSVQTLVFMIGGSYGLPPEVSRLAHEKLSLSAMTLPHRLARLILAEQVYRAFTIQKNEPYSH